MTMRRSLSTRLLSARWRALLVTAALAALTGACGLRTAVRPPEDTAPIIPGQATVQVENGETVVQWKRANESADGRPLTDLAAFIVEKRSAPDADWQTVATIDVIDQEKYRRRRDFSWRESSAKSVGAQFRVLAVCADGEQGPPNVAIPRDPLPRDPLPRDTVEAEKASATATPDSADAVAADPGSDSGPASDTASDTVGDSVDATDEDANTY